MKKSKWWQDIVKREDIISNINESTLNNTYNSFAEYRKASDEFRAKTNLSSKEYANFMADASLIYSEIMLYNNYFNEVVKEPIYLPNSDGTQVAISCNNMESYGKRVALFAKKLEKLNITETDDVVKFLPILRTSIALSLALRKDKIDIDEGYAKIANDYVSDISKIKLTMKKGKGYVVNEVETELNRTL